MRGYDVGVTWHEDEDGARETAREVESAGRRAEVRRLDLLDLPDAADVIDELADELGGVDVLVNNSGTSRAGAVRRAFLRRLDADTRRRPERRVPLRAARRAADGRSRDGAGGSST